MNKEAKSGGEAIQVTQLHIMKFGGTSVGKVDGIHNIGDIVERERLTGQVLVVASALNGTTDSLFEVVDALKAGQRSRIYEIFSRTMTKHFEIAQNLMMSTSATDASMHQIAKKGLALEYEIFDQENNSANQLDKIVSYGEELSTILISSYLQFRGIPACLVDAASILRTTSEFGHAQPLWDETGKNARIQLGHQLRSGRIPVIGGFYGADAWGNRTILQRGGSDNVASILARGLNANRLTFFKEVDGIYDKNPDLFTEAVRYNELTMDQANKIANEGNKVLSERSMEPLLGTNIRVEVRSTFSPFEKGTTISS